MDRQRLTLTATRSAAVALTVAAAIITILFVNSALRPGRVSEMPGCGAIPELVDSAIPDPVELQRGPAYIPPIIEDVDTAVELNDLRASLPVEEPSSIPGDFSLQLVLLRQEDLDGDGSDEWIVRMFFGSRPPTAGETLAQYLDAGGILFRQQRTVGVDAKEALKRLADQGRSPLPPTAAIGPYEAVAIHADPTLRNDLRPWHLYWSDGVSDFNIQGDVKVESLVEMARSLYCSD